MTLVIVRRDMLIKEMIESNGAAIASLKEPASSLEA